MADPQTTSIVLRVRRTVVQDAYISVPVTSAIMKVEPEPDGSHRLDVDALVGEGIRLSGANGVEWETEEQKLEPHPTQKPVPPERRVFAGGP